MKAMDYMKQRYEEGGREELTSRPLRNPNKLQRPWQVMPHQARAARQISMVRLAVIRTHQPDIKHMNAGMNTRTKGGNVH